MGSHVLHLSAVDVAGNISPLLNSISVSYTPPSCPVTFGAFVPVVGNAEMNTDDFCVAVYEMKNSTGAKSQSNGVTLDEHHTRERCKSVHKP